MADLNQWTPSGPAFVARTPAGGFALQNGTPTILSWTAPNDGQEHQAIVAATLTVSAAETGGQVFMRWTSGGVAQVQTAFNPNLAAGAFYQLVALVDPGTTIHLDQNTALTAGAATVTGLISAA